MKNELGNSRKTWTDKGFMILLAQLWDEEVENHQAFESTDTYFALFFYQLGF